MLASDKFKEQVDEVLSAEIEKKPTVNVVEKILEGAEHDAVQLIELPFTRGGLMLYTSGTTSRPKGVVLNTSTLTAQADSLRKAWDYAAQDHVLHALPLHHIHGTVNCLLTPLYSGSAIEFLFPFNPTSVWERLARPFQTAPPDRPQSPAQLSAQPRRSSSPKPQYPQPPISFMSAVPTIWTRMLSTFSSLSSPVQAAARTAISPPHLRLNISGSAALPTPVKNAWSELSSGNILLERYGMTEVGMALSCGLDFQARIDGSVGWPLPSVEVRLMDTETNEVIKIGQENDAHGTEREGEIQLRGPTIFGGYWRNDEATAQEFVEGEDGKGKWFKTGDIATRRVPPSPPPVPMNGVIKPPKSATQDWINGPSYFILGRKSTDILKTGGEKVSALEVERELLALPQVAEAAVVGLPSDQWGQKVCAVVVLEEGWEGKGKGSSSSSNGKEEDEGVEVKKWSVLDMRKALKGRLATVKVPQEMRVVPSIRRNAMGKGMAHMLKVRTSTDDAGQSIRRSWSRKSWASDPPRILQDKFSSALLPFDWAELDTRTTKSNA